LQPVVKPEEGCPVFREPRFLLLTQLADMLGYGLVYAGNVGIRRKFIDGLRAAERSDQLGETPDLLRGLMVGGALAILHDCGKGQCHEKCLLVYRFHKTLGRKQFMRLDAPIETAEATDFFVENC
jgi:hypothetical protein